MHENSQPLQPEHRGWKASQRIVFQQQFSQSDPGDSLRVSGFDLEALMFTTSNWEEGAVLRWKYESRHEVRLLLVTKLPLVFRARLAVNICRYFT